MNLGQIIYAVQRMFGDTSGVQITEDDIIRWANLAQIDIARKVECIQEHVATDTVAEDGSYPLPENFLSMKRVTLSGALVQPTTLEKSDAALPYREVTPVAQGTPTSYFIWRNTLYLHPVPSVSESAILEVFYVRLPAPMLSEDDSPEIPETLHEDIIKYCLIQAKELDEDSNEATKLRVEYLDRMAESRDEALNKHADSYPSVRLLPGDDW